MKHILANEIRRDYGADPFVSKLALQLADLLEMDNAKGKMFNQIINDIRKDEREKTIKEITEGLNDYLIRIRGESYLPAFEVALILTKAKKRE